MTVFGFKTCRAYLKSHISRLPKKGRGEITKMANFLNVSSTLVSHILSGEKNLTTEQAHALSNYLGLIGIEADYFNFLVQFERAGTPALQDYWKQKLDALKEQSLKLANRLTSDKQLTEEKRAIFYSSPLFMAVRLFTSIGDKGKTVAEIAQRFDLTMKRCSEILSFLVDCGLCEDKGGRFTMGAQKLHLEKASPHLLRFQTDWRMRAIARGEDLADEELLFTAPISLSKKDFETLREETVLFIKRFLETVHSSDAEEIACFNIDLFWIKK